MQLISINEASEFSGKSIQTIRRMIKQKKIQVKRQKTPQGFNYLITKESLLKFLDQRSQADNQSDLTSHLTTQNSPRAHRPIAEPISDEFKIELERLNTTIQKLIEQNERDKENFFRLIKTFQDRNIVLEEKINLLDAPKSIWWQFWK